MANKAERLEKQGEFAPLRITGRLRLLVWLLLLALTAAIFAYPATFKYEYHPIQPLNIFHNPPVFAALFLAWLLVLFGLLFSRGRTTGRGLEPLALVGIFALVFEGYWAITSAGSYPRQDGAWQAAIVRDIGDKGRIDIGNPSVDSYMQFPGIHTLTHALSLVSGLDTLYSVSLIVTVIILIYAAALYWLSVESLGIHSLAAVAAIVMLQGNLQVSTLLTSFHAANLGVTLMAIVVAMLYTAARRGAQTVQFRLATVVLLGTLAFSHLVSAMVVAAILLAAYLLQDRRTREHISVAAPALALVLPLAWLTYLASRFFMGVAGVVKWNLAAEPLSAFSVLWGNKVGNPLVPLWANGVQTFWLLALTIPLVLLPFYLYAWRRLGSVDRMVVAGLVGVMLLGIGLMAASPTGVDMVRFLAYAPLFTVPLALKFFMGRRRLWRGVLLGSFVFLAFALTLPTFLANNRNEAVRRFYASDESAPQFLASLYGTGKGLTIFEPKDGGFTYDLYRASIGYESEDFYMKDVDGLWKEMDKIATWFDGAEPGAIYVYSRRLVVPYEGIFQVQPSDVHWENLLNRLEQHPRFYDNGNVVMYVR
jgi:hypothetical protein